MSPGCLSVRVYDVYVSILQTRVFLYYCIEVDLCLLPYISKNPNLLQTKVWDHDKALTNHDKLVNLKKKRQEADALLG